MSDIIPFDILAEIAEDFMEDRCLITRPQSAADNEEDTWDDEAGAYAPEDAQPLEVYRGKCMLYSRAVTASTRTEAGGEIASMQQYLSLPVEWHIPVLPEDEVIILESNDPTIIGEKYYVEQSDGGTLLASREILISKESQRIT